MKFYAIGVGEYEEHRIEFTFKSEDKRDKMFDLLSENKNEIYEKENFETCDDKFDLENVKHFYYADCNYCDGEIEVKFKKGNNILKDLYWEDIHSICNPNEISFCRIMSDAEMDMPLEIVKKMLKKEAEQKIINFKGEWE